MEKRKQLTFDIDTKVAKEILGEKNYTTAYSNIKSYMKKHDWTHIEGSVYMSNMSLSNTKVSLILKELKRQYPYLTKCIREMHQADISDIHSLNAEFDYDGTPGKYAIKKEKTKKKTVKKQKKKSR